MLRLVLTVMRSLWIKVFVLLASVWLVVGGVMFWAGKAKPTPERLSRYLDENRIDNKTGQDRERTFLEVAEQLNGLDYEQRRQVRMGKQLDQFFRSLTPEEQSRFLDLTLPTGFKQMMESFNKMDPARRKRFVENALKDMQDQDGEGRRPDDPHVQKMVKEGLRSFYSDANADVKMDFAPLIEQMQRNLQWGR